MRAISECRSLAEQRDHALRDLVDLERQVERGEIDAAAAADLRARYEGAAARAIEALAVPELGSTESARTPAVGERRGSRGRLVAYGTTAAAVVLAAVLLPGYVAPRPVGGAVTGNEVLAQARADAGKAPGGSGMDLSRVSDQELEAVVSANPDVVGMRLALADRYLEAGRYEEAAGQYRRVLDRDPGDPDAQAHYGWLLLHLQRPQEAATIVDQALRRAPDLVDGLWFKANIDLYGLGDPAAALVVLDGLAARPDLSPTVRQQVDELAAEARRRRDGNGG